MIRYREFRYDEDIDEVVTLINENLDTNYSKDILLWKHLYNPFGQSISMVATENKKIVAVVFYMWYNFEKQGGETIKSLRPVDGCTNKEYRGKGLFKKLLRASLNSNISYDILFSTPNSKSLPEVMKLGWVPLSKYKFRIGLINPFKPSRLISVENYSSLNSNRANLNSHGYFTSATSTYFISWRFKEGDYVVKKIIEGEQEGYLIYRVGRIKKIKCLILCDYIGNENLLNAGVNTICKKENLYFVYYLNNDLNHNIEFSLSFSHRRAIMAYKENKKVFPEELLISMADLEGRL